MEDNETVITSVDQLERAWFEAVLRQSGALESGEVASFEVQTQPSENSGIWKIRLTYRSGSTSPLPERLLLKLCGGSHSPDFGPSEVLYYTRDYAGLAGAPLVKCYSAVYSVGLKSYHLLLQDLSGTHTNNWENLQSADYALPLAEALATLHACHWSSQPLVPATEPFPDAARLDRFFAYVDRGLEPMLASLKEEFDPTQISLIEREYRRLPARLMARLPDRQGFTLVHGDVNPGNILSPRSGNGPLYLLDRQPFDWSLTTWLALSDLAYTLVLWWKPELRREKAGLVLRRYHASLLEKGITGYSWPQLVEDYNLCVAFCLWVPVEWNVLETDRQRMRWLWLEELNRILAALAEPVQP